MSSRNKPPPMKWLRTPVQQRSRKSLERILDAAERILEKKNFAEMSVSEIVSEGRSSVGVFYSRFGDKLALLHLLDDRFTSEATETCDRQLDIAAWKDRSLPEATAEVIGLLCRIHREKKGMLRSIVLQVRQTPDPHFQQNGRRLTGLVGRLADFLARWKGEMDHPRPEHAVRLAMTMLMATIRESILFGETTMWPGLLGLSDEEFEAALTDSFLRQCGVPRTRA